MSPWLVPAAPVLSKIPMKFGQSLFWQVLSCLRRCLFGSCIPPSTNTAISTKMIKINHSKVILAASLAILIFLFWLLYGKEPKGGVAWIQELPLVNAVLNGTTSIFLLSGYFFIKKSRIRIHILFMSSAMMTSILFLVSYCIYHYHHGHTPFNGTGWMRYIYFPLLISHIILSVIQVPLIGFTLFYSLKKQYRLHKRVARWTLPIWLYVSVTGVAVFFFLRFN